MLIYRKKTCAVLNIYVNCISLVKANKQKLFLFYMWFGLVCIDNIIYYKCGKIFTIYK